jgi:hypothetical protein
MTPSRGVKPYVTKAPSAEAAPWVPMWTATKNMVEIPRKAMEKQHLFFDFG